MTLTKRYALITVCVIIFLIIAPVLVLGIQGYIYDFENKKLVRTGIIVIQTEPKDVEVKIEGNNSTRLRHKSGTVRFLIPGDYEIQISKNGYETWHKRMAVKAGLVTWVNESADKIFLIPKEPKLVKESRDWKEEPVRKSSYIYKLEKQNNSANVADLVRENTDNPADRTIVLGSVPYRPDNKIYATPSGVIFLVIDRTLYQAGAGLEYIADGVESVTWEQSVNKLVYGNPHELSFYNPYDSGPSQRELILRTSEAGGSFCIMPDIGYALRSYDKNIKVIELDGRDRRNIYDILPSETRLEIVECDYSVITVKENGNYKTYALTK